VKAVLQYPNCRVIWFPWNVSGVAHVPYGMHPTAVYRRYDCDRLDLEACEAASRRGGAERARYLDAVGVGV
jgi:hypothetical protein